MPKITVMLDGAVLNQIDLTKAATTVGRRPYNDIVLNHLTVSGEHAVLHLLGSRVTVQDLHSTNGTYVGGKAVATQDLHNHDVIEMGKYRLRFETDPATLGTAAVMQPDTGDASTASTATAASSGLIAVLSGSATGRKMMLTKGVTTLGKPGLAVAVITQRQKRFFVHHVQGTERLTINGETAGENPRALHHRDRMLLAGTEMQFLQA